MNTVPLEELLTLDKIAAWLDAQDGLTTVGYAAHACDCPVYRYLKHHGVPVRSVSRDMIYTADVLIEPPTEIRRLVDAIDDQSDTHESVSVEKCRRILQTVRR